MEDFLYLIVAIGWFWFVVKMLRKKGKQNSNSAPVANEPQVANNTQVTNEPQVANNTQVTNESQVANNTQVNAGPPKITHVEWGNNKLFDGGHIKVFSGNSVLWSADTAGFGHILSFGEFMKTPSTTGDRATHNRYILSNVEWDEDTVRVIIKFPAKFGYHDRYFEKVYNANKETLLFREI